MDKAIDIHKIRGITKQSIKNKYIRAINFEIEREANNGNHVSANDFRDISPYNLAEIQTHFIAAGYEVYAINHPNRSSKKTRILIRWE